MTLACRVIPCLDVADGRVVKGVNFENLRDMGDPVELAALYFAQGADEITFLDVTATVDERATTYDVVRRTAEEVFIPLTVGGGVRSGDDVSMLLSVGADKIGVNSAAIARPGLIDEIADRFGAQVLVLSLDVKRAATTPSGFVVTTHGGRTETRLDALDWAREAVERGRRSRESRKAVVRWMTPSKEGSPASPSTSRASHRRSSSSTTPARC